MACGHDDVERRYLTYVVFIVSNLKNMPDSATPAIAVLPACRQNSYQTSGLPPTTYSLTFSLQQLLQRHNSDLPSN